MTLEGQCALIDVCVCGMCLCDAYMCVACDMFVICPVCLCVVCGECGMCDVCLYGYVWYVCVYTACVCDVMCVLVMYV